MFFVPVCIIHVQSCKFRIIAKEYNGSIIAVFLIAQYLADKDEYTALHKMMPNIELVCVCGCCYCVLFLRPVNQIISGRDVKHANM